MPGLDERIERALRDGARPPDADPGVVTHVIERKRARRQTRRNAATGALVTAVLVVAAVVTVGVLRRDGDGGDVRVSTNPPTTLAQPADPVASRAEIEEALAEPPPASPTSVATSFSVDRVVYVNSVEAVVDVETRDPATGAVTGAYRGVRMEQIDGDWRIDSASLCRIDASVACGPPDVRVSDGVAPTSHHAYAGTPAVVEELARPETEYARAPVVSADGATWVAVYDREGATYTFPPSHLVDINSGRRIDLKGEILSVAAGNDRTLWAVTRDEIVDTDGTEFRLKRIDGGGTVHSEPIPAGEQPVGRVVAGAGAAWVPAADGVLRFHPGTGIYQGRVSLTGTRQLRAVAVVDGAAYVTDGPVIARIDGDTHVPVFDTGASGILSDLTPAGESVWALAVSGELFRLDVAFTKVEAKTELPQPSLGMALAATGDRAWVRSAVDLTPVGDLSTTSVAGEDVLYVLDDTGIAQTILVAGATDAAVALEPSGSLVITSGGHLYRADLP